MPPIYSFLFFLSQQDIYFDYQDSILDILSKHPENNYPNILKDLEFLHPDIVFKTLTVMQTQDEPVIWDDSIKRSRYGDALYPDEFKKLIDPPLVFSYLGEPIWKKDKIAIVGSRQPSQKTLWWLRKELEPILSHYNLVSVSGGAIGVDQLVHQGSLDLKLPTLAVLPSGLRNLYPKSFHFMTENILSLGGCVLSEFRDALPVHKHHFKHRNRLIAALGKVSVVVEAQEKSGTLITAHRALEMGKDVFVVPGHPMDPSFKGSLELLKLGAHILTESNDLSYWL